MSNKSGSQSGRVLLSRVGLCAYFYLVYFVRSKTSDVLLGDQRAVRTVAFEQRFVTIFQPNTQIRTSNPPFFYFFSESVFDKTDKLSDSVRLCWHVRIEPNCFRYEG